MQNNEAFEKKTLKHQPEHLSETSTVDTASVRRTLVNSLQSF